MKTKLFCFIFFLLFVSKTTLFTQNIDSLKKELGRAKEDTNKINTLLLICAKRGTINDSERIGYSKIALQLSEKLNYPKGLMRAQLSLGASVSNLGKYDESLDYLNQALKIGLQGPSDKIVLADIYNAIAGTYYYQSDYSLALTYYLKGLVLYEELKIKSRTASAEYNISLIYYQNKEYEKAIEFINNAHHIFLQLRDTVLIAQAISQLGNINFDQCNYEKALMYYKQSLSYTEKLQDKSYSLTNFVGIGNILADTRQYSEALSYHQKALEIAKNLNDEQNIAISLMNVGHCLAYTGRVADGVALLHQALKLSRKVGIKRSITDAYAMLYEIYEKENNFMEAFKYSKLYIALTDSIFNEENAEQINSLSSKYENEKRKKELALLNIELLSGKKDQEILHAKVEEKNTIIIAIAAGVLLLTISFLLFFRGQQLKQRNKHQTEISKQQGNTAIAIIQAQESERNRIAQDLHDGIGTFLSTLKINLESFEDSIPNEKKTRYKSTSELVDKTASELRNIMKDLSSEALQENGLVGALQELADGVNRLGNVRLHFLSHGLAKRLDTMVEINLYRVAQELINNCLKHARATQATLQLIDHENMVLLMMEDNGSGFDPQDTKQGDGYRMGLKNIRNRISFINGTLKTESTLGKGSTFIIEIPKQST